MNRTQLQKIDVRMIFQGQINTIKKIIRTFRYSSEVTVCDAESAFFQIIVSLTETSTIPVVDPSFSLCQKNGTSGLAAPVGILIS